MEQPLQELYSRYSKNEGNTEERKKIVAAIRRYFGYCNTFAFVKYGSEKSGEKNIASTLTNEEIIMIENRISKGIIKSQKNWLTIAISRLVQSCKRTHVSALDELSKKELDFLYNRVVGCRNLDSNNFCACVTNEKNGTFLNSNVVEEEEKKDEINQYLHKCIEKNNELDMKWLITLLVVAEAQFGIDSAGVIENDKNVTLVDCLNNVKKRIKRENFNQVVEWAKQLAVDQFFKNLVMYLFIVGENIDFLVPYKSYINSIAIFYPFVSLATKCKISLISEGRMLALQKRRGNEEISFGNDSEINRNAICFCMCYLLTKPLGYIKDVGRKLFKTFGKKFGKKGYAFLAFVFTMLVAASVLDYTPSNLMIMSNKNDIPSPFYNNITEFCPIPANANPAVGLLPTKVLATVSKSLINIIRIPFAYFLFVPSFEQNATKLHELFKKNQSENVNEHDRAFLENTTPYQQQPREYFEIKQTEILSQLNETKNRMDTETDPVEFQTSVVQQYVLNYQLNFVNKALQSNIDYNEMFNALFRPPIDKLRFDWQNSLIQKLIKQFDDMKEREENVIDVVQKLSGDIIEKETKLPIEEWLRQIKHTDALMEIRTIVNREMELLSNLKNTILKYQEMKKDSSNVDDGSTKKQPNKEWLLLNFHPDKLTTFIEKRLSSEEYETYQEIFKENFESGQVTDRVVLLKKKIKEFTKAMEQKNYNFILTEVKKTTHSGKTNEQIYQNWVNAYAPLPIENQLDGSYEHVREFLENSLIFIPKINALYDNIFGNTNITGAKTNITDAKILENEMGQPLVNRLNYFRVEYHPLLRFLQEDFREDYEEKYAKIIGRLNNVILGEYVQKINSSQNKNEVVEDLKNQKDYLDPERDWYRRYWEQSDFEEAQKNYRVVQKFVTKNHASNTSVGSGNESSTKEFNEESTLGRRSVLENKIRTNETRVKCAQEKINNTTILSSSRQTENEYLLANKIVLEKDKCEKYALEYWYAKNKNPEHYQQLENNVKESLAQTNEAMQGKVNDKIRQANATLQKNINEMDSFVNKSIIESTYTTTMKNTNNLIKTIKEKLEGVNALLATRNSKTWLYQIFEFLLDPDLSIRKTTLEKLIQTLSDDSKFILTQQQIELFLDEKPPSPFCCENYETTKETIIVERMYPMLFGELLTIGDNDLTKSVAEMIVQCIQEKNNQAIEKNQHQQTKQHDELFIKDYKPHVPLS